MAGGIGEHGAIYQAKNRAGQNALPSTSIIAQNCSVATAEQQARNHRDQENSRMNRVDHEIDHRRPRAHAGNAPTYAKQRSTADQPQINIARNN